jgi:hypothetical protein
LILQADPGMRFSHGMLNVNTITMKNLLLFVLTAYSYGISAQAYTAGTHYSNYHDILPDTIISYQGYPSSSETYSMDMFGSSAYDLQITARSTISSGGSQAYIKITSLDQNLFIRFGRWDSVYYPGSGGYQKTKIAAALEAGDTINAAGAVWDNTELFINDHSSAQGGTKNVNDFVGGDKYIGLKFIDINKYNEVQYGWIHVRCVDIDSCYVKEYSRTAMVTGIYEIDNTSIRLYPNPAKNYFYLENKGNSFQTNNVKVTDLLGKSIDCTVSEEGETIKVHVPAEIPAGCYFVNFNAGDKTISKKLIKTE